MFGTHAWTSGRMSLAAERQIFLSDFLRLFLEGLRLNCVRESVEPVVTPKHIRLWGTC